MRLFLCLKGSDKFEQEVFEALYGNQSRRDSTDLYFCDTQSGYRTEYFIDFFMIPLMWYVRFCEWLIYPTYDNGFNQKIAYTGGEAWVIRFLAIVAVLFILAIVMIMIVETIKQYKKCGTKFHRCF